MKDAALCLESSSFSENDGGASPESVAGMETKPSVYQDPENLPKFRPNPARTPGGCFVTGINFGKLAALLHVNALRDHDLPESQGGPCHHKAAMCSADVP